MARLQTLLLPNGGFAFVVDQHPEIGAKQWREFATNCGARDILVTDGTIRILEPFAESPTEPETTSDPEPAEPWEVRPVGFDDAPEFIQRFIGAAFGAGPFADLHQPCGHPDCEIDAKQPPTDGEAATDNQPSEAEQRLIGAIFGEGPYAEPTNPDDVVEANIEPAEDELTEREKRVEKILAASGTVQRLDESGAPVGERIPFGSGGLIIIDDPHDEGLSKPERGYTRVEDTRPLFDDEAPLTIKRGGTAWPVDPAIAETFTQSQLVAAHPEPPLDVDTSPALIAPEPLRTCGAGVLGAPCALPKGHPGLHEFGRGGI